jgi:hypothetical protein
MAIWKSRAAGFERDSFSDERSIKMLDVEFVRDENDIEVVGI